MKKPDLIDELMSTEKLNSFFDTTEQTMVSMIGTPIAERTTRKGAWWMIGGAIGIALTSGSVWMMLNQHPIVESAVVTTALPSQNTVTSNGPTSGTIAPNSSPESVKTSSAKIVDASNQQLQTQQNDQHELVAQINATPTIEASTQRELDSLRTTFNESNDVLQRARLSYQIGLRQRLLGDIEAAVGSLRTSQTLANTSHATVLEARSIAEQARCELRLGRSSEARTLFESAIRVLSDKDAVLREQWIHEREAVTR